ncbi:hypothetical protein DO72_2823 [Burkholderia pseudomallei]|nr:hypothetical protein DO72_2823 [Burkholderia pseudomallei]KGX51128.1 hypothetical protein Y024_5775 [Burkholderia pseudomallei TSV44]
MLFAGSYRGRHRETPARECRKHGLQWLGRAVTMFGSSAEPSVSFGPFSFPQIPRNSARGQTGQGRTIC